ncbi:MAG: pectinesterase family protein [Bacteroidota bacterium]|nr:pectinesterase family protein [Bacteroidota bacterium]
MKTIKILIYCLVLFFTSSCYVYASGYDIVVAPDGSGNFRTIQAAINVAPDNCSKRTVIFVKNGVYREKVIVPSSKINLTIIGESTEHTLITWDDYNPKVTGRDTINTWTSFTFAVDAEGFRAENISFENAAGRVGQAVAVRVVADQVVFMNCRFLGNQDTLFAHGIGRMYFSNCYIEGTTDFIFGSAVALFENCRIHIKINSYYTAASTPQGNRFGYVFKNCHLTADKGVTKAYLGRPWRAFAKTVFINCTMDECIRPEGWSNWNDPQREQTTFYAEYNSRGKGANPLARVKWSKQLSDEEAAAYTLENVFTRNSVCIPVVGSWNPLK